jgi:hypothetical protein
VVNRSVGKFSSTSAVGPVPEVTLPLGPHQLGLSEKQRFGLQKIQIAASCVLIVVVVHALAAPGWLVRKAVWPAADKINVLTTF